MILTGTMVMLGYLVLRSIRWPLIHDAPLMHYIAWLISQGAVPYRDAFDMNFPGVYLIHLAVLEIGGAGDGAWRLFDFAWLGSTSIVLFLYCRPMSGVQGAMGAVMLFALHHLSGGAKNAGQRDFQLAFFLLAGAYAISLWAEGLRSKGALLWSGIMLGGGMTVKPHSGLFFLMCAAAVAFESWSSWNPPPFTGDQCPGRRFNSGRRYGRPLWTPLGWFLAGGTVLPAAVVAWLWLVGGAAAFFRILTEYLLPLYSRVGSTSAWVMLPWYVYVELVCLAALCVLGLLSKLEATFAFRRRVALLGVLYGFLHFAIQGKGWEYHLYPAVLFLCALAAPALSWRMRVPDPPVMRGWLSIGIFAFAVVLLGAKGTRAADSQWAARKIARVEALSRELHGLVPSGGRVQVMDVAEGGIHALLRLGLRQPTRFIYDFHFFHDERDPRIQALRKEFATGLWNERPSAIVVFSDTFSLPGYELLEDFHEVKDLLETSYILTVEGDGYRIYEKRSGS